MGKKALLARHLIALLRSQKLIWIFSILTSSKFGSLKFRDEIYQKYLENLRRVLLKITPWAILFWDVESVRRCCANICDFSVVRLKKENTYIYELVNKAEIGFMIQTMFVVTLTVLLGKPLQYVLCWCRSLGFPKTRELWLSKAAFTITFFAAVNHRYDPKQRTFKHRNSQNGSKSTNHKSQTMTFWTRWNKLLFLRGPLRWLASDIFLTRGSKCTNQRKTILIKTA